MPPLRHFTKAFPKRADELIAGGSMYWVIGGVILVRQRLLGVRQDQRQDGTPGTAFLLDPELVQVEGRAMRAFQGWRYLEAKDAPPDLHAKRGGHAEMPEAMRRELVALGLL